MISPGLQVLNNLLFGVRDVLINGVVTTARSVLDFVGGPVVTDVGGRTRLDFSNLATGGLNVKGLAYGALGDGTTTGGTDDTAAIQAAINASPAGGTVFLPVPSGLYRITSALTIPRSGIRIVGAGPVPSRIHQANPAADCITTGTAHVSGLQFENLWLTGQGPNGAGNGIVLNSDQTYGSHHVLRGVRFGGSGTDLGFNVGLLASHCMAPLVIGCQFWQNGYGVEMLGASNGAVILGSEFAANWRGLRLKHDTLGGTLYPVVGVNVLGCIFQSQSWDSVILENVNGNLIQGCYFEAGGAYLGGGENVYDVLIDDGIAGAGAVHYCNMVLANSFRGSNAATPPYRGAVHVVNGQGHVVERNVCTTNAHIVIEAAALRTELGRNTMLNSSAVTDGGAGTVVAPVITRDTTLNRPTLNLRVGDMHWDTTLNKPVWVASLGPVVWKDAVGGVV